MHLGSQLHLGHKRCSADAYCTRNSDISDRKRLEDSLKKFLTCMMGDMRQPLANIEAAAQLLTQQPCVTGDDEASFCAAAISASCTVLSCIVKNVLSLRSMEAGDWIITAAPFSIREMVNSVLAVCRMSLAHCKSTTIEWSNEAEPLPLLVLGDCDRLAQVLQNLLTNACKFSDGTEVTVTVRCEEGVLTLVVADRGRGMAPDEIAHIFEAYHRAPTHKGGGTGLGAYMCSQSRSGGYPRAC